VMCDDDDILDQGAARWEQDRPDGHGRLMAGLRMCSFVAREWPLLRGARRGIGGHVLCAAARPGILYRMCARKATARKAPREQVGLGSTCALRLRGASRPHRRARDSTTVQCSRV